MPFDNLESLRDALNAADAAIRQSIEDDNIQQVMHGLEDDIVSVLVHGICMLTNKKKEYHFQNTEGGPVQGRVRPPAVLLPICGSVHDGQRCARGG